MSENNKPSDQEKLAAKALALKQANEEPPHHPHTDDHADEGIQPDKRPDQPPSGNFDAEGQRPVLERSRKVR
ncbi:hypothetical protein [Parasphingorhabdus sp.]|uniref:hypothetical protein n=1 Tax=Parasphingorhabdus sp. TaxID=2709688 RepID=UPI00359455EC